MSLFEKHISCSLSPNTEFDDVFLAFRMLLSPWSWKNGDSAGKIEEWFRKKFETPFIASFNAGRSALLAILKAFEIKEGDEILVQAFTCVAVPNSVRWAGAMPVFVDIDSSFNIDITDAEKKISSRTKGIIVQHTFGIPAQLDEVLRFAKKHKLIIIEDCAHALGGQHKKTLLGKYGHAAFFSFGRDKILSSVFGGVAIINSKYRKEGLTLENFHRMLPMPSSRWICQQLLHPILFSVILRAYSIQLGKLLLFVSQRLGLLSFPVDREEYKIKQPPWYPAKYPNALATLLVNQLAKLERFNTTRKFSSISYYNALKKKRAIELAPIVEGAVYLRFPCMIDDRDIVMQKMKKNNMLLGTWYSHVVDPPAVVLDQVGYTMGSCPKAENAARRIINLPTLVNESIRVKIFKSLNL